MPTTDSSLGRQFFFGWICGLDRVLEVLDDQGMRIIKIEVKFPLAAVRSCKTNNVEIDGFAWLNFKRF